MSYSLSTWHLSSCSVAVLVIMCVKILQRVDSRSLQIITVSMYVLTRHQLGKRHPRIRTLLTYSTLLVMLSLMFNVCCCFCFRTSQDTKKTY